MMHMLFIIDREAREIIFPAGVHSPLNIPPPDHRLCSTSLNCYKTCQVIIYKWTGHRFYMTIPSHTAESAELSFGHFQALTRIWGQRWLHNTLQYISRFLFVYISLFSQVMNYKFSWNGRYRPRAKNVQIEFPDHNASEHTEIISQIAVWGDDSIEPKFHVLSWCSLTIIK